MRTIGSAKVLNCQHPPLVILSPTRKRCDPVDARGLDTSSGSFSIPDTAHDKGRIASSLTRTGSADEIDVAGIGLKFAGSSNLSESPTE